MTSTMRYCRSLFSEVLPGAPALLAPLSWITRHHGSHAAFSCYLLLKPGKSAGKEPKDPYAGIIYRVSRKILLVCMRFTIWVTCAWRWSRYGFCRSGVFSLSNRAFPELEPRAELTVDRLIAGGNAAGCDGEIGGGDGKVSLTGWIRFTH